VFLPELAFTVSGDASVSRKQQNKSGNNEKQIIWLLYFLPLAGRNPGWWQYFYGGFLE
jgi:hypothetical protein